MTFGPDGSRQFIFFLMIYILWVLYSQGPGLEDNRSFPFLALGLRLSDVPRADREAWLS